MDHPRNDLRSIPILELMDRLRDIPGVSFYSLQKNIPDPDGTGRTSPDQTEIAARAGMIDFTPELSSFDDTAALMCNLDLVIALDGVIAHLAGALDIPTWVAVDVNAYWGWGRYKKTTVWYRSVTIYRQKRMHRWEEVLEEIRDDLQALRPSVTLSRKPLGI